VERALRRLRHGRPQALERRKGLPQAKCEDIGG